MGHAGEKRFSVTAQVRGRGQADEPAPRDLWVLQVLGLPLPKEANKPDWNAQEWDTLWTPMGLDHPLQASLWNTIEDVLRAERPDLVASRAMIIGRFIWGLSGDVFEASRVVREALAAGMTGPPPRTPGPRSPTGEGKVSSHSSTGAGAPLAR